MLIRRMNDADAGEVANIEKQSFNDPWTYFFEGNESIVYYVAEVDGRIVSFVGLQRILDECEVLRIATLPECRGRGYAERVLELSLSEMRDSGVRTVFLEVRDGNAAAIELYIKCGFSRVGIRKKYYENMYDAVVMQKHL